MAERRPALREPAPFVARGLRWGLGLGALAGGFEAAVLLSSWSLQPTLAQAAGFHLRSVLYGATYLGAWSALWAAIGWVVPALRRRVAGRAAGHGRAWSAGVLAAGVVLLHGVVTWRVGLHVNDPWSSPVLWAGLAAVAALAAAVGVLVGAAVQRLPARWRPRDRVLLALLVLTWIAVPLGALRGGGGGDGAGEPRVLLVTLDTFRADRVGALGGPVPTPALDALAAGGVQFEQAVSQAPITCPSHLSILSGVAPTTHGVFANGTRIPDDLPLLSEAFGAGGVPTAAFVAGYPVTARFGFDRGFDVFDDDFSARFGDHRLAVRRLVDQGVYARGAPRERRADAVLARAVPWLRRHAGGGFFCWVHLFDPHGPYDAPAPFGGSLAGPLPAPVEGPEMPRFWPAAFRAVADPGYWVRRYDEEIAYTDDRLGALLAVLAEEGIAGQTVVVVVGDHGESLDEHGYYFDHGLYLYDATLRVPLIVAGPGVPAGRRVPCQVRGIDVAPTALELAGLDVPAGVEGESLRPLWEQGCRDGVPRRSVAVTVEPPTVPDPGPELALRADGDLRYKLVRHHRGGHELYDLEADPGETRDVAAEQAEIAAWMAGQLDSVAEGMPVEAVVLPADVEAQLRALGYIDDGPRRGADDDSARERPPEDR